jgi:hypothetical protein
MLEMNNVRLSGRFCGKILKASPITAPKRTFASALRPSDSYRTVHIECNKCNTLLFKYKKKNGTKSKLVKIYTSRIIFDPYNFVHSSLSDLEPSTLKSSRNMFTKSFSRNSQEIQNVLVGVDNYVVNAVKKVELKCPKCNSEWGRPGVKSGHDIFKCIGGKIRMS